jgi:hypothetical protein
VLAVTEVLYVAATFLVFVVAAVLYGVDSRDGSDWVTS